ncbi:MULTISPECIES: phosphatase PAP2 family protein [unclassified Clostridium]|uniref:phosphatase PAP2 family protein n=1 Tax=unclassified Clostridium TaxID=2614128 RepID=UPI001897E88A|nr:MULTISPECIES: phosphatase PAP2 family protein [unclassified Clostridium]MBP3917341.1 phosphatase PAP2 family protein [Clostridium sp.]MEE0933458.1 phosphatase PAP2 family protein [Clostridium sp.]
MIEIFKKVDNTILRWINVKFRNKTFDKIMPIITSAGNLGIIWIVISVLLITKKDYRVLGQTILIALVITTIIGEGIIKNIVKRKRPFYGDDDKELLISRPITYSFPSGHTASSFAVATVFIKTDNAASLEIMLLACLIAFSRIYLGVHYPSDVIGGGIIGTLCGLITVMLFMSKFY